MFGRSRTTAILPPLFAFFAACSAGDADHVEASRSPVESGTLPCDVDTLLARSCRGCHSSPPQFGAPMSLGTYTDLHAVSASQPTQKIYERVLERVHADTHAMPPPPNAPLSRDELAVLDRWASAGAPAASAAGGSACNASDAGAPPVHPPLSCTPDVHLAPTSPWAMPETTDDIYVCYGFDVTSAQKRHLVGIAPKIDNPAIVHHLLLFQADRAVSSTPTPCTGNWSRWRIVYGWAPGGGNFELPPEAGFAQEATTHYALQVHYNNVLHRPGQQDSSGFDFCTTDHLRPHDADTIAFGSAQFQIPPRSTADITCDSKIPAGIPPLHLFAAFPHMHQLGTAISTVKVDANGAAGAPLGAQLRWDFQNQVYMPIDATIAGGDTVRTRCAWENPGDTAVTFGERTEDEMCFSFTMFWPRVDDPSWHWMTPTQLSRCAATP
jgi:hypothetical protein